MLGFLEWLINVIIWVPAYFLVVTIHDPLVGIPVLLCYLLVMGSIVYGIIKGIRSLIRNLRK